MRATAHGNRNKNHTAQPGVTDNDLRCHGMCSEPHIPRQRRSCLIFDVRQIMKTIRRIILSTLLLLPLALRASLEDQIRTDLEGALRRAFGNTELNEAMLKRVLDEGVAEVKSQEPWLLTAPDSKHPLTTDEFDSTFTRFMKLAPKDRRRDILTYYILKKDEAGLNTDQMLIFYRLMQYQLAAKNAK
jgi:hypothetical protein